MGFLWFALWHGKGLCVFSDWGISRYCYTVCSLRTIDTCVVLKSLPMPSSVQCSATKRVLNSKRTQVNRVLFLYFLACFRFLEDISTACRLSVGLPTSIRWLFHMPHLLLGSNNLICTSIPTCSRWPLHLLVLSVVSGNRPTRIIGAFSVLLYEYQTLD